jgi:hypothetical protein
MPGEENGNSGLNFFLVLGRLLELVVITYFDQHFFV